MPVVEAFGESRFLPARRREAGVAGGERQQGRGVLAVERHGAVDAAGRKFGVEADVAAFRAIIIFAIDDDPGLGENGAQGQALAPAGMNEDQVGNEAVIGEPRRGVQHLLGAAAFAVEPAGKAVGRRMRRGGGVAVKRHAGHRPRGRAADGRHLHVRGAGQRGREIAELRGKIVVDEQELHATASRASKKHKPLADNCASRPARSASRIRPTAQRS